MPREIVLGNGKMLINFDQSVNMRDFYYPFVGMENHICGHKSSLGVWVNGSFSWLDGGDWQIANGYRPDSLVSRIKAVNPCLGIKLEINGAVHYTRDIYVKKISLQNMHSSEREVRLFFHHDFSLGGSDVGDTALYDPKTGALIHYKRQYYFLFNGRAEAAGFYQYTTGIKRFADQEGTWRDAEDGNLVNHPVAQGSVDSTASLRVHPGAGGETVLYYWIVAGNSFDDVKQGNSYVLERGVDTLLAEVESFWRHWVDKIPRSFAGLDQTAVELFKTSLLVVRTQCDQRGAILAANDTDIMATNRDNYSYLWPRDGALVAHALERAGYPEVSRPFYFFCRKIITPEGFFWPKYNADGSVGSNWHPWIRAGQLQLPVQEDETALVLWALGNYYRQFRDFELIKDLYPGLIKPAAGFLTRYRDPSTGLPLDSYDLWEERRGVFTFTVAAVYAGLAAAADCAALVGDSANASQWREAARQVRAGMLKYLYSYELGRFIRGISYNRPEEPEKDFALESSLYGVFAFGALPAAHPRVAGTMRAIREGLQVQTEIGGIARYSGDYYFRRSADIQKVPGNPWFICTLWLAEWYAEAARDPDGLAPARLLLDWAARHQSAGGMLAEQLHPYTGEPLSVSPLTWSHATYILAVLKYIEKYTRLAAH